MRWLTLNNNNKCDEGKRTSPSSPDCNKVDAITLSSNTGENLDTPIHA